MVVAVGLATGIGIVTAELFLAQRDSAEAVQTEDTGGELDNPFTSIEVEVQNLGNPSTTGGPGVWRRELRTNDERVRPAHGGGRKEIAQAISFLFFSLGAES